MWLVGFVFRAIPRICSAKLYRTTPNHTLFYPIMVRFCTEMHFSPQFSNSPNNNNKMDRNGDSSGERAIFRTKSPPRQCDDTHRLLQRQIYKAFQINRQDLQNNCRMYRHNMGNICQMIINEGKELFRFHKSPGKRGARTSSKNSTR